jgi:hypothetical protein
MLSSQNVSCSPIVCSSRVLRNDADDHEAGRQTGEVCFHEETRIRSSDHFGLSNPSKKAKTTIPVKCHRV